VRARATNQQPGSGLLRHSDGASERQSEPKACGSRCGIEPVLLNRSPQRDVRTSHGSRIRAGPTLSPSEHCGPLQPTSDRRGGCRSRSLGQWPYGCCRARGSSALPAAPKGRPVAEISVSGTPLLRFPEYAPDVERRASKLQRTFGTLQPSAKVGLEAIRRSEFAESPRSCARVFSGSGRTV